jgi:hypothetical protein
MISGIVLMAVALAVSAATAGVFDAGYRACSNVVRKPGHARTAARPRR